MNRSEVLYRFVNRLMKIGEEPRATREGNMVIKVNKGYVIFEDTLRKRKWYYRVKGGSLYISAYIDTNEKVLFEFSVGGEKVIDRDVIFLLKAYEKELIKYLLLNFDDFREVIADEGNEC